MKRLLVVLLAGCSPAPVTEIVLSVDQVGINVGRDIDTIHISAGNDKFSPESFLSIGVALCAALPTSGCHDLPLTATLVPGKNMPTSNVRLLVQAKLHGDGDNSVVRISDVANFHFTQGESLQLEMVLTPNCLDDPLHCAEAELSCGQQGCFAPVPEPKGADLAVQLDLSAPPDLAGVDLKDVDFACRPDCPAGYCGLDKNGCNVACNCDTQAFTTCGAAMSCVACGLDNMACCPKAPQCQSSAFACDPSEKCVPCVGQGNSCSNGGQPCCSGTICSNSQCATCGHANEPCCAGTPSCGTNLTCVGNQCTPCGTLNNICCNNGVDPPCEPSTLCEPNGGGPDTCHHCGDPGEACCTGSCNVSIDACNGMGNCAPCGDVVGAGCCGGNICMNGLVCTSGGLCAQPPDMAMVQDMSMLKDMATFIDMAVPKDMTMSMCGGKDQPCCTQPSTPPCAANWLICPSGTCTCGSAGQPCCEDITPFYCTGGATCDVVMPSMPPGCSPGGGSSGGTSGGTCPSTGTCGTNCCFNGIAGTCAPGWSCCMSASCFGTICSVSGGQCYQ